MAREAFSAGVKPGGLTNTTQIRILLCYIIRTVAQPLSREELEEALMGKELVNYFDLIDCLSGLEAQGLVTVEEGRYHLTDKGRTVADLLLTDLPRSVREQAVQAAVVAQQWARKAAENQASVLPDSQGGFLLDCRIRELDQDVFRLALSLPDSLTAQSARAAFVAKGGDLYKIMLALLSDNKKLAQEWIKNW